ncbi:MAG: helix-turn-helix domain-containing protein [Ruminococcus sp.]|nr:helix-turn-helix domain-containing protein [Ruminococcus sp.]MBP3797544.1 helix-turn-helix domain-containing protein [Ruminococcus sp.]MBQ1431759.1 helix-turn-helix domain-containing protein [Ruminococcus sp.]
MIVHLDGDFETVDYTENRSVLIYDNVENEEYPVHWHNAIEIIMPLTNPFTAVCDGKVFDLKERDILIIPAGTLHTLKAQPGRRLIMLFDNRSISTNPALYDLYSVLKSPLLINDEFDEELRSSLGNLIKEIYTLYSNFSVVTEVYIYIKLLTLLARIKENQINAVKYDDEKYLEKFGTIIKYIEQNYMYNITLDDLAKMAGYSKYHFSRIFKKYSRTTFISFLNHRRIKAAEMLLLDENISVTEAAMQVGFSSLTTFNRVFREIKGCTPTEFRKLYKITNVSEGA